MGMTREDVGALLLREIESRGWTRAHLSRLTGVDPNTIGDLLRGHRAASAGTRLRVEKTLGWPEGAITDLEVGRVTPDDLAVLPERMSHRVCLDGQTAGVVDLPPEVEAGLTEAQAAEVRAHAYAEAMRRRREILNGA